jgi:hypothetical protein
VRRCRWRTRAQARRDRDGEDLTIVEAGRRVRSFDSRRRWVEFGSSALSRRAHPSKVHAPASSSASSSPANTTLSTLPRRPRCRRDRRAGFFFAPHQRAVRVRRGWRRCGAVTRMAR